jgi:hypothetical protein
MGYAEAIRQLTATLEYWRSPRGRWHAETMLPHTEIHLTAPQLQTQMGQMLSGATAFFVSRPITELLAGAAQSIPSFKLAPHHLIVLDGWVYFETPIALPGGEKLRALLWSFATGDAGRAGIATAPFADDGELRPPILCGVGSHDFDKVMPFDGLLGNGHPADAADSAFFNRLLATLMLFLQDHVLVESPRPVLNRQARKHIARVLDRTPTVHVIELRRREYEQRDGSPARDIEYTCQWLVRGHWRNHWFPASSEHRPMWIAPHVKGPADKPLRVAAQTVFEVVR